MMNKVIISLILLYLASILVLAVGCDGSIYIKGKAYEWINAPMGSESMLFIETASSEDIETVQENLLKKVSGDIEKIPLNDVKVTVVSDNFLKENERFVKSNREGALYDGWIIAPGNYQVIVEASKPGYKDIEKESNQAYSKSTHVLVIILVKRENSN